MRSHWDILLPPGLILPSRPCPQTAFCGQDKCDAGHSCLSLAGVFEVFAGFRRVARRPSASLHRTLPVIPWTYPVRNVSRGTLSSDPGVYDASGTARYHACSLDNVRPANLCSPTCAGARTGCPSSLRSPPNRTARTSRIERMFGAFCRPIRLRIGPIRPSMPRQTPPGTSRSGPVRPSIPQKV